jgi:hypothetical protein
MACRRRQPEGPGLKSLRAASLVVDSLPRLVSSSILAGSDFRLRRDDEEFSDGA